MSINTTTIVRLHPIDVMEILKKAVKDATGKDILAVTSEMYEGPIGSIGSSGPHTKMSVIFTLKEEK